MEKSSAAKKSHADKQQAQGSAAGDRREFVNDYQDYNNERLVEEDGMLAPRYSLELRTNLGRFLQKLYTGLETVDSNDYSIYTGIGGIALLHLHLYYTVGEKKDKRYLERALDYIKQPLQNLKGRKFSFLCGDAGPLALGVVLYNKLGKKAESQDCLMRLQALHYYVCSDPSVPDEILNGRVGYLYALLFVKRHLGSAVIDNAIVTKVFKTVLESGQALAQQQGWKHPLMYQWHEKHYLGAAHGLSGIYYMLMQVTDPALRKYVDELVKPSVDYMLSLRFPSGNCPSSVGSSTGDKLVHWCHGAPGWIYMFIMAYKLFKEEKYLAAARGCADVIWERGLLKKGCGICHGTAGNGYAHLAMYQLTGDLKYVYRAFRFAEWCYAPGKTGECRTPDRPYSLFEGLAGTIHYLVDILAPRNAEFPAFQLS